MDKIRVLIFDGSGSDKDLMDETLYQLDYVSVIGEVDNLEEAKYILGEKSTDIVVIGSNIDSDKYLICEELLKEVGDLSIILIDEELKEDTMYKALFSGAKDVIISPFSPSKLVESIYRVFQMTSESRKTNKDNIPTKKKSRKGNIITVFSTKGGVGKTFVSTNLAISLSKNTDKSVCLIDLDLDFGNTILALNLLPRFTLMDIVDDIRNIDQDNIESYLSSHDSGIKVLPANPKPQINEFITSDHIELILKALRSAFDYVIVDMPGRFYEPVNPSFALSDILLMITTPEISAVRNIKSSIMTLYELNYPKSKIKVILNKNDKSSHIRTKDVESTLGQELYSIIDADYKNALMSMNNGIPIVIQKPKSNISKSIFVLAKKVDKEIKGNGSN